MDEANKDVQKGAVTNVQVPFQSILNFRDVGKTINAFLGKKYVLFLLVFSEGVPCQLK